MTQSYWTIRFKRKAHKKARWKRAELRMLRRDANWVNTQKMIQRWVNEA